jgi:hypothetical protein
MSCDKKERVDLAPSLSTFPQDVDRNYRTGFYRLPLWVRLRIQRYEEWLRDFEASLRSEKELLESNLEHDVCCPLCLEKGELMKIKEMLGE